MHIQHTATVCICLPETELQFEYHANASSMNSIEVRIHNRVLQILAFCICAVGSPDGIAQFSGYRFKIQVCHVRIHFVRGKYIINRHGLVYYKIVGIAMLVYRHY